MRQRLTGALYATIGLLGTIALVVIPKFRYWTVDALFDFLEIGTDDPYAAAFAVLRALPGLLGPLLFVWGIYRLIRPDQARKRTEKA